MYLKNKWNNLGIKNKLFIISTTVILITSIITYTILFFVAPTIYSNSREKSIKNSTENLIKLIENDNEENYIKELDKFSYENKGFVLLKTLDGKVLYASNDFLINKPPFSREKYLGSTINNINKKEEIKIIKRVKLKALNEECILEILSPNKLGGEIQGAMLTILPIIFFITIIIGVLSQYVYSVVISKPLLKINDVSRKISKMDFDEKLNYKGNDEIAELSESINSISENLEETINDLKEANKKLLSDIEREKLQDRRRRDFIKAISHELKTPITVINGQIEGMIYNIGPYKDRDKYLKESLDSVNDLKALVQEIINLARYEESIALNYENINLNDLVYEIVYGYNYLKNEKRIDINIKEEGSINIFADSNIIKKVISNLINNSIKYSDNNKDVNIILKSDGTLKIINYSEGIENIDKEALFTAFYRGEKSRNKETGGSGLGLYIVKTLLELHKDIDYKIDTKDGKFIFTLKFKSIK